MESSDSQMDKPQHGRPKRAELLDVNINTDVQSINNESVLNYINEEDNGSSISRLPASGNSSYLFVFQDYHANFCEVTLG